MTQCTPKSQDEMCYPVHQWIWRDCEAKCKVLLRDFIMEEGPLWQVCPFSTKLNNAEHYSALCWHICILSVRVCTCVSTVRTPYVRRWGMNVYLQQTLLFIIDWSITYLFWLIENCLVLWTLGKKKFKCCFVPPTKTDPFYKVWNRKAAKILILEELKSENGSSFWLITDKWLVDYELVCCMYCMYLYIFRCETNVQAVKSNIPIEGQSRLST